MSWQGLIQQLVADVCERTLGPATAVQHAGLRPLGGYELGVRSCQVGGKVLGAAMCSCV